MGSICHRYMCIVLYMKHICVIVFQRSILNWRRGCGQSAMGLCALCYIYMTHIWCNGFPEIYAQLEEWVGSICNRYMCIVLSIYVTYLEYWFSRDLCLIGGGGGSICHGYMCIVLYMKLIWCSAFAEIYAQLEEGGNLCGVMVLQRSMLDWRRGGQSDIGICPLFYIYRSAMRCAKFGVTVLKASMVDWGVSLPGVFVYCAIYETYFV